MKYLKVQTNRATLTKIRLSFQEHLMSGEKLIAPRPLPRQLQKFYYALAQVAPGGRNIVMLANYKNIKELTKEEFDSEIREIKYFWFVGENDA